MNELIERATETFMKFGIRSVTMDDLARNLRVSKKTLYQVASDKGDLVMKCMEYGNEQDQCAVLEIRSKELNAIDELYEISKMVSEHLKDVHPSIFYDLEKYYPEAWDAMHSFKHDYIYKCIHANLENGKEEGLYRVDANAHVIAMIYTRLIPDLLDPEAMPEAKLSSAEIYLEFFRYHIRGIASQKGIDYLKKKVQEERSKLS